MILNPNNIIFVDDEKQHERVDQTVNRIWKSVFLWYVESWIAVEILQNERNKDLKPSKNNMQKKAKVKICDKCGRWIPTRANYCPHCKDIDDKNYNILLSHNPLYVSKEKVYKNVKGYSKLNLILSGHTHNGLLPTFIKTNTVFISPNKRFFVPRARGSFKNDKVDIVITGGVVKLSYVSGIFRFFNFLFPINIDYINIDKR